MRQVDTIEKVIMGNPEAVDDEILKLGVLGYMRMQQIERRNITRTLKGVVGVLGGVVVYVLVRLWAMINGH